MHVYEAKLREIVQRSNLLAMWTVVPFTKMGNTRRLSCSMLTWAEERGKQDQKLYFEHFKCDMPVKHPSKDVK